MWKRAALEEFKKRRNQEANREKFLKKFREIRKKQNEKNINKHPIPN